MLCLVPIVEGDGEKEAVPLLLRRVLHERLMMYDVNVLRPIITNGKGNLLRKLEKFLDYALEKGGKL